MKSLFFIMIFLFCTLFSNAQKGKVTQAVSYFTSGKLDQAKKLIDEAMGHEACQTSSKAYYVKGQIYQAIAESTVADYRKLDANALNTAWEAFQKVIQLDEKNKYTKKLVPQYRNLIVDYSNRAVDFYNKKDFANALTAFQKVLEIGQSSVLTGMGPAHVDTVVIFNAAISAQRSGNLPVAEQLYKETLKYNYELNRTYAMLASVLKEQGKSDEAVKYLLKGYEFNPENSFILVELINYYLLSPEPEKAGVFLDAAIRQDPQNASFYRAKGTLYEKLEQPEKAEVLYKQALEIDPNDFLARYNLGNIRLTEAINYHRKVIDIVDVDEYNKEMENVYQAYETAVPYFEKALELKPDEKNTVSTLKELYFKLRNRDAEYQKKYEQMKIKYEQLP